MFQYQKKIGNQEEVRKKSASTRIVQKHERIGLDQPNVRVVQKVVAVFKPKTQSSTQNLWTNSQIYFNSIAGQIDTILQGAYDEFMGGNYTGANPSYVIIYKARKYDYDNGKRAIHPAAAAGYVIESKVNGRINGMAGVHLQDRDIVKGSRPDIVLQSLSGERALLDITASNSVGHILTKRGNWLGRPDVTYVAELLYPSIDFARMTPIGLTKEEIDWRNENIYAKLLIRQEIQEMKEDNFVSHQKEILNEIGFHQLGELYPLTARQYYNIIINFRQFGIALPKVEAIGWVESYKFINCSDFIEGVQISDFFSQINFEKYSCFDMDRKANYLIEHIKDKNLQGIQSFYSV